MWVSEWSGCLCRRLDGPGVGRGALVGSTGPPQRHLSPAVAVLSDDAVLVSVEVVGGVPLGVHVGGGVAVPDGDAVRVGVAVGLGLGLGVHDSDIVGVRVALGLSALVDDAVNPTPDLGPLTL